MFLSSLVFIGSRFRAGWNHVHAIGRTPVWTVGLRQDHTRVILASPETEHGPGAARDHRRGTRPFRHASHLEAHAHLPRPSSRRPGLFHARGHDGHARHRQPTAPRKNRGAFHLPRSKCPNPPLFPRRTIDARTLASPSRPKAKGARGERDHPSRHSAIMPCEIAPNQ